jgi:glucan biosynthesis protein C
MPVAKALPSVDRMTAHSPTLTPDTGVTTRLHGLDALRAGALLLGIVLHSLLPFGPQEGWLVQDSRTSTLAEPPVFVIHLFRMTLFMLLAGFFGRLVVQRRGPGRYLRDRVLRILLPFCAFWPLVVLPMGLLVVLNADLNGAPMPQAPASGQVSLLAIPSGHLWFLLVLFEAVLLVLAAHAVSCALAGRERADRVVARLGGALSGRFGVLLAALPYAVGLWLQGDTMGGIREPVTLVPSAPALTAYVGAFVVGWALHADRSAMHRFARRWPGHLGVALALTVLAYLLREPGSVPLALGAPLVAVAGWAWVYALIGVCVRFLSVERPAIRYLADASYWMYLVHLPLLVAFEIVLVPLPWPILAKLVLTWAVTGAVMLVSYHLLVRSTPLGQWLNGRRHPFRWPWSRVSDGVVLSSQVRDARRS